jgi:hypothetical protein
MNENRNFAFDGFPYRPLLILVFFLLASHVMNASHFSILGRVHGHLVDLPGAQSDVMSKSIGNYVILFQTRPSQVQVNDNTTLLRFSIMQNNQDTYNVFAALIIKEKNSGNISIQFPYRFYEFGDIDFRHTFQSAVDHEIILQTRVSGDPYYQNNPLVASFDVPVMTGGGAVGIFTQIIVILVLVALPVGIFILILDFNKRMKRNSLRDSSSWK